MLSIGRLSSRLGPDTLESPWPGCWRVIGPLWAHSSPVQNHTPWPRNLHLPRCYLALCLGGLCLALSLHADVQFLCTKTQNKTNSHFQISNFWLLRIYSLCDIYLPHFLLVCYFNQTFHFSFFILLLLWGHYTAHRSYPWIPHSLQSNPSCFGDCN